MDETTRAAWRARPVDEVVQGLGVAEAIGLKHVASLLFTYRCSIACGHCLFSSSPRLPDVCVSVEDGVAFLHQLRALDRVVHIAGGEAMVYWDRLLAVCQAAGREGVAPHFVETNAFWCTDDAITRERLTALKDAGVLGLLISADPHHQAFVAPERRKRAYDVAVEVYGRENVAASDLSLAQLDELQAIGRDPERLADYVRAHPPRLLGRAAEALGRYFPDRPLEELADDSMWHGGVRARGCRQEFDPVTMWEIHIDPYGNLQTCCGIVLGNAHETPLPELWARGFDDQPLIRLVAEEGPFGYLRLAEQHGYVPQPGYRQKCHLCWEARKYLRPWFGDTFGPAEIYDGATIAVRPEEIL